MRKPRLLDLYCCAGGCSVGYARSGFEVVGVDIKPQKNYPFQFIQGDALEVLKRIGKDFDIVHASPPCQKYSRSTAAHRLNSQKEYPDLVASTREAMEAMGLPYIMENVPGAPLSPHLKLSGYHFGLKVIRWRWFELGKLFVLQPGHLRPTGNTIEGDYITVVGKGGHNSGQAKPKDIKIWKGSWKSTAAYAMDIDWMTWPEMAQAIPPAYTEFIGSQIITQL